MHPLLQRPPVVVALPAVRHNLDDLRARAREGVGVQLPEPLAVVRAHELQAVQLRRRLEVQPVGRPEPLLEGVVLLDGQEVENAAAVVVDADDCRLEVEPLERQQAVRVVEVRQVAGDENQRVVEALSGTPG